MEPLFRSLVLGLVPRPKQMPPEPFDRDDLQRAFFDVSRTHPYQQFALGPGGAGAEFVNSPEDGVSIQPMLIQLRTVVDGPPGQAREKAVDVLKALKNRLRLEQFLQGGLKIVATVPLPPGVTGRDFVADKMVQGGDVADLGPNFYAGGVKYRSIEEDGLREQVLLIEPFVMEEGLLFVDYDIQRRLEFDGSDVDDWIDEAFDFVRGPTMQLLEVTGQ